MLLVLATHGSALADGPDVIVDQRLGHILSSTPPSAAGLSLVYEQGRLAIVRGENEVVAAAGIRPFMHDHVTLIHSLDGRRVLAGGLLGDEDNLDGVYLWEPETEAPRLVREESFTCTTEQEERDTCRSPAITLGTRDLGTLLFASARTSRASILRFDGSVACRAINVPRLFRAFDGGFVGGRGEGMVILEHPDFLGGVRFGAIDVARCRFDDDPFRERAFVNPFEVYRVRAHIAFRPDGGEILLLLDGDVVRRFDTRTHALVGEPLARGFTTYVYATDGSCIAASGPGEVAVVVGNETNAVRRFPATGAIEGVGPGCTTAWMSNGTERSIVTHHVNLETGEVTAAERPRVLPSTATDAIRRAASFARSASSGAIHVASGTGTVFTFHSGGISSMACGSGAWLATSSSGVVRAFTGDGWCDVTRGTKTEADLVAVSASGRFIVTKVAEGHVLADLEAHTERPLSIGTPDRITFSRDGLYIGYVTGHAYRIRDLTTDRDVMTFDEPSACYELYSEGESGFGFLRCEHRHAPVDSVTVNPRTRSRVVGSAAFFYELAPRDRPSCVRGVLRRGRRSFPRAGDCRRGALERAVRDGDVIHFSDTLLGVFALGAIHLISLNEARVIELHVSTSRGTDAVHVRYGDRIACADAACAHLRRRGPGALTTAELSPVASDARLVGELFGVGAR